MQGEPLLDGESMEPHRQWGFLVLHLIPALMIIAAIVGRMGRTVIVPAMVLLVLVFLQPLFANSQLHPTPREREPLDMLDMKGE
jgi:hypothetical protein